MLTMDIAAFRLAFPVFASDTQYPDILLENYWAGAVSIFKTTEVRPLQLLTAHLITLGSGLSGASGSTGIETSASIDGVSVTTAAPPFGTSAFRFWLLKTPYGAELLAYIAAQVAGGFYVGGRAERSGFRKLGGNF